MSIDATVPAAPPTPPALDWVVLVDLRDDIMQDDLQFRFEDLHAAEAAVAAWLRECHVARTSLGIRGSDGQPTEIHEVYPLSGVKKFEIRFQPLKRA